MSTQRNATAMGRSLMTSQLGYDAFKHEITAGPETLMDQAAEEATYYLRQGVKAIDEQFGEGFAKENPALLGAFLQASARAMSGPTIAQQVRAGLDNIAEKVEGIDDGCDNIADATEKVAESLGKVAVHLKYLGVGDAGTTMGAVEYLAAQTKEGLSEVASALDRLAERGLP